MEFFLRVSFGTVVALTTAVLLFAAVTAAAQERWDIVGAAAVVWASMAVTIAMLAALWIAAVWLFRQIW